MSDLEPMDPELRTLLRGTKGAYDAEASAHAAAALARLASSVPSGGGGGGGGGASTAAKSALAKLAAPIAVSLVVGAGIGGIITQAFIPPRERIVYVDRPVSATVVTSAETPPAPLTMRVDQLPSVAPPIVQAPSAAPSPSPSASVAAERLLLDGARSAFASGDFDKALAVLRQHGEKFPNGALSEEREALTIRALAALGRKSEALTHARTFLAKHPESIMRPAIESAVSPGTAREDQSPPP